MTNVPGTMAKDRKKQSASASGKASAAVARKEKTATPKTAKGGTPQEQGMADYLQGVRHEWQNISWPTWPQIWAQTLVVIVMVTAMTLGIWAIDTSLSGIISLITPSY